MGKMLEVSLPKGGNAQYDIFVKPVQSVVLLTQCSVCDMLLRSATYPCSVQLSCTTLGCFAIDMLCSQRASTGSSLWTSESENTELQNGEIDPAAAPMTVSVLCACAGLAVAINLLQPNTSLTANNMQHLNMKSTDSSVQPDLVLLALLLDTGLFEQANGALQAGLVRTLMQTSGPPPFADGNLILDASTIMLPSMVAQFTRQGYYAQAAELCAYHTGLHPAYYSLNAGLQRLQPYLSAQTQHTHAGLDSSCFSESSAVPNTMARLGQRLSSSAELALQRMSEDKFDELL